VCVCVCITFTLWYHKYVSWSKPYIYGVSGLFSLGFGQKFRFANFQAF
jgi:hypothetical protein